MKKFALSDPTLRPVGIIEPNYLFTQNTKDTAKNNKLDSSSASHNHISPFALAGRQALSNAAPSYKNDSRVVSKAVVSPLIITEKKAVQERVKILMPLLTLKRLRKIQALVRGFIVRRTIYRRELALHQLCERIFDGAFGRVMDKQVPNIALEVISFNKYNEDFGLYSQNTNATMLVANGIIDSVIENIAREVVSDAITSTALRKTAAPQYNLSPPQLIFKLNDPIQLLAYSLFMRQLENSRRQIAQSAISDTVQQIRENMYISSIVEDSIIPSLYDEILKQSLEQYTFELVAEGIMQRQSEACLEAVLAYQRNKYIQPKEALARKQLHQDLMHLLIYESVLQCLVEQL